jgi:hypothetical protein
MKALLSELKRKNIIWITPKNKNILYPGQLNIILDLLSAIAERDKDENFNMMPKLINVRLASNEVVEAVANANFKKGVVELLGIFLYDCTKIKDEEVRSILQKHSHIHFLN